jgi:hypothetical protein
MPPSRARSCSYHQPINLLYWPTNKRHKLLAKTPEIRRTRAESCSDQPSSWPSLKRKAIAAAMAALTDR